MVDCLPNQKPYGRRTKSDLAWEEIEEAHPFPVSAMISVTTRCDLDCGHCEVVRQDGDAVNELDARELTGILEQLADCGVLFLTLTGGEPTLRSDLEDIVAAAVRLRFYVGLKTNGAGLTQRRAQALIDAGLHSANISLYSFIPRDHDRFVGRPGAFEKSVEALKTFRDGGLRAKVSVILMEWNAIAVSGLLDFCEANRFNYTVDLQIAPRADGGTEPLLLRPNAQTIAKVLEDRRLVEFDELAPAARRDANSHPCQAARTGLFIDCDGEVRPCSRLPMSMGNLRSSRFDEIWLRSEVRERLLEIRWSDLPVCSACENATLCSRCPGIALLEHGDLMAESAAACAAAGAVASFRDALEGGK